MCQCLFFQIAFKLVSNCFHSAFKLPSNGLWMALELLPQWFIMVGAITGFVGLMGNFLSTRLRNFQAPFVVKLMSGMICGLGLAIGLFIK